MNDDVLDDIVFENEDRKRETNLPPLRSGRYRIFIETIDGNELCFYSDICTMEPMYGSEVRIDGNKIIDGKYLRKDKRRAFEVISDHFVKSYRYESYRIKDLGGELIIETEEPYGVEKGNPVFIDGIKAYDGRYKIGWLNWIEIENGKVFDFLLV